MLTPETSVLDECAVSEIEAQLKALSERGEPWEPTTDKADTFRNVAARHALALCATVRALREALKQIAAFDDVEASNWLCTNSAVCTKSQGLARKVSLLAVGQNCSDFKAASDSLARCDYYAEFGKTYSTSIHNWS